MEGDALLLAFDSDEPDFVRGFEIGRLWQALRTSDGIIEEVVHATNAEMLLRLAEATGRAVSTKDLDDSFVLATFGEDVYIGS